MKIPPAFYSRISNSTVFLRATSKPASKRLLQQQLVYFGKLVRRDGNDPVRASVLEADSLDPRGLESKRRVGRPRLECATEIRKHAAQAAGSQDALNQILLCPNSANWLHDWRQTVGKYVV